MMSLLDVIRNLVERLSREVPPGDKLQLDAAQDRLQKRTEDLKEATDALSQMLKRMTEDRRTQDKKNKRQRAKGCRK